MAQPAYARATAGCSHTTVSHVFSQPRLPSWGSVELIVESMHGDVAAFHERWLAASGSGAREGLIERAWLEVAAGRTLSGLHAAQTASLLPVDADPVAPFDAAWVGTRHTDLLLILCAAGERRGRGGPLRTVCDP